jgi:hypothetical protein
MLEDRPRSDYVEAFSGEITVLRKLDALNRNCVGIVCRARGLNPEHLPSIFSHHDKKLPRRGANIEQSTSFARYMVRLALVTLPFRMPFPEIAARVVAADLGTGRTGIHVAETT